MRGLKRVTFMIVASVCMQTGLHTDTDHAGAGLGGGSGGWRAALHACRSCPEHSEFTVLRLSPCRHGAPGAQRGDLIHGHLPGMALSTLLSALTVTPRQYLDFAGLETMWKLPEKYSENKDMWRAHLAALGTLCMNVVEWVTWYLMHGSRRMGQTWYLLHGSRRMGHTWYLLHVCRMGQAMQNVCRMGQAGQHLV